MYCQIFQNYTPPLPNPNTTSLELRPRPHWGSAPDPAEAPPPTPQGLRPRPRWGSAPTPLGLRPRFRWDTAPDPHLEGVWGGAPARVRGRNPQLHSCGEDTPGFGTAPTPCVHDSIKPAGLVRRRVVKFFQIQFGGWAVRTSPKGSRVAQRSRRRQPDYVQLDPKVTLDPKLVSIT